MYIKICCFFIFKYSTCVTFSLRIKHNFPNFFTFIHSRVGEPPCDYVTNIKKKVNRNEYFTILPDKKDAF